MRHYTWEGSGYGDANKKMDIYDKLTFRNHKGEEKTMTRQEFRNAAAGQQNIDHRPNLSDTPIPNLRSGLDYVQKATPKDRIFELTHINGKNIHKDRQD